MTGLRGCAWAFLLVTGTAVIAGDVVHAQVDSVRVNGVTLRYEIEGRGDPLVLVHGWTLSRREWDGQAELLAPHYRVIRYDRRGFGESGGKPDDTADPADLKASLESLGHSRASILRHSQGAGVGLTFAVRYPEMTDALILFGAGAPDGFGLPWDGDDAFPFGEWAMIAQAHGVDSLKAAITAVAMHNRAFGADVASRDRNEMALYRGLEFIDPAPPSSLVAPARIDELRAVTAPTLVVIGEREMPYFRIVADALTYGISGARKVVIPGGGHAVSWSEPERFVAEVLRFLRTPHDPPGGS